MTLYMFWTVPLSIITSFSLYTQQWHISYMFADSLRAGLERSSVLMKFIMMHGHMNVKVCVEI